MRESTGQGVQVGPGLAPSLRASVADRKEREAAPHLLDPQVLVWPRGGQEQGGPFRGIICVGGCQLGVERHCELGLK